jgi:hypothetical protein
LLGQIEQIVTASRSHSPFNRYLTRLNENQTKAVNQSIGEIRSTMLLLVHQSDASNVEPLVHTSWAVRETLAEALSQLPEQAQALSIGSGELQGKDIDRAKALARIRVVLQRLDEVLASSPNDSYTKVVTQ